MLGFERKARLFCDTSSAWTEEINTTKNSWDLSVRLGYFVTEGWMFTERHAEWLGFDRKARLFCDILT